MGHVHCGGHLKRPPESPGTISGIHRRGDCSILPEGAALVVHDLHCAMQSLVVLSAVTAAAWVALRRFRLALAGWWAHADIDIPTHSRDYYKVQALYPLSDSGVDGIAWNEPWFFALNYLALAVVYAWLYRTRVRDLAIAAQAVPGPMFGLAYLGARLRGPRADRRARAQRSSRSSWISVRR